MLTVFGVSCSLCKLHLYMCICEYDLFSIHMRQAANKSLLTIDEYGSKIPRNSVFYCHLSPVGRQMAIKHSVSNDF